MNFHPTVSKVDMIEVEELSHNRKKNRKTRRLFSRREVDALEKSIARRFGIIEEVVKPMRQLEFPINTKKRQLLDIDEHMLS